MGGGVDETGGTDAQAAGAGVKDGTRPGDIRVLKSRERTSGDGAEERFLDDPAIANRLR